MRSQLDLAKKTLLFASLLFGCTSGLASGATILVDQGHGQPFVIEKNDALDLSKLAGVCKAQGMEVKATKEPLTAKSFKGISGLIISGAFKPFAKEEMEEIIQFISKGGKLSLMLHIPHAVRPLLSRLEVAYSQSPLYEQENILEGNSKNFKVNNLTPHPLTKGLPSFNAYGVWGVMPKNEAGKMIATTSPRGWIDMNDNGVFDEGDGVYSYGVAVAGTLGKGGYVVFGDDAIFQNQFLVNENLQLAQNLAAWLQGGK